MGVGGKDEYVNGLWFEWDVGKFSWNDGGFSMYNARVERTLSWDSVCWSTDGVVLMANGLGCFLPLHPSSPKPIVESRSNSKEGNGAVLDTSGSLNSYPSSALLSERELRESTKRSLRYNGRVVSFDNARLRCSAQPTSSELRESRPEAEVILSEAILPRRVSRKRVGEDGRDDFDLLLTELVEYRRVRRPLCDMSVTRSESSTRGPITRSHRSVKAFPRPLACPSSSISSCTGGTWLNGCPHDLLLH